ncbi:MAG: hemerythrin domain-containing protein [Sulfitobacter sp.]|jgi:hemerythrin HHE cation binding domain-containing protein|uniref:hemerythrin domain-containing protein n=1 Tax=Sulfitobacter sp. TaxID=1903071 RepID=UPI000C0D0DC7|nr:hemerythrin [Roseobacter sp.]MBV49450.1 hemerythrin [Roseobacter sp.]PHR09992.1 MAG: hemerythrin [Sulfitobacter sp.]|tara:strand:+ start:14007 stop:14483 length:477 start_codon:yes stop_codon:yes gene_type:complete
MTSIYDAIKADHETHRTLLNAIAETSGDSTDRQRSWQEFYTDVKSHAAAEEETFYSKLMHETWGQDAARHSVSEHKELDDLMEELNEADMSSSGWLVKFKKLKHDYEHHMDEEEADVFKRAKEVIGAEHNDTFGKNFQKRKQEELGLIDQKRQDSMED